MRLINCSTLQLEEFLGSHIPPYAILSHTWGDGEVTFAEFTTNPTAAKLKPGYRKIHLTCKQALRDRLLYAWVDTVCIAKSSSSELLEAINSMFTWYKKATQCYAYITDVTADSFNEAFPKARWFTRGWTLQELLAPWEVMFYDRDWRHLGTRTQHAQVISQITKIDRNALIVSSRPSYWPNNFSIAQRMSWASSRKTTRVEDTAYCLMGIFKIHMPLLYGEGEQAFQRLQQEIIRNSSDDSILAWGLSTLR